MSDPTASPRDSFVAICGRVFHSDPDYFPQAEYRGRRIYLCTDSCLGAFLSDPDRFVAAHKKRYAQGRGVHHVRGLSAGIEGTKTYTST
jgi:YHS domain-containing protein